MTIEGLDISSNQATTPSLAGIAFVIVKATEGTWHDPMWPTHSAAVLKAGRVLSAFEFGVDGLAGDDQARRFLGVVGNATKLVGLDVEGAHATHPDQIRAWMTTCKAAGKTTLLYASEGNWPGSLGQDANWVANWSHQPALPWAFWQHRGSPLDLDTFNGDLAALKKLAGIAVAPAAPAPVTRYVVIIAGGRDHPTTIRSRPTKLGTTELGPLYAATVVATKSKSAPWWYRITAASGDAKPFIGKYFPAQPWMTAKPS